MLELRRRCVAASITKSRATVIVEPGDVPKDGPDLLAWPNVRSSIADEYAEKKARSNYRAGFFF